MSNRQLAALMLGAGIALVVMVPSRSVLSWVDPVTGSLKFETKCFLVPLSTTVHSSALERWIIRREGSHSNRWEFLSDTSSWLLVRGRSHACGLSPEIFPLHAGPMSDEFVRLASDAEIAEFLRIMREGTGEEKKRSVESACERMAGHPAR